MIEAVIIDVVRTASGRGKPGGALSEEHPVDLLASVLNSLITRNGLDPALVDDVIGGCVNQASEQSTNITRAAVLAAGFPEHVPATTIDRQCGSSQQAATFAAQAIVAGFQDVVIACGVESMSRVPMGTPSLGRDIQGEKLRVRYPDGLVNQGVAAELIAARWGLSRAELDEYSVRSHERASEAAAEHGFDNEIVPLRLRSSSGGTILHSRDETVRPATTVESLGELPASFADTSVGARFPEIGWKITAGNSSPLTDGASAALIMSRERATQLGLRPRARFVSFAVVGDDPILMLTGPIPATQKVLDRARLSADDIDIFEVNEAFAPVPLAWANEIGVLDTKLNPRGGAIALGHALGSSGTRLLATLVNGLEATGGRYGLQTMCEGGGMANATIIERL
ncbi:acetyl-CoA acyltransferase [Microbacterium endophyticum]|uniref:Acetyl-CoA acyltransferase n=1 Tax=Microbacterium endophyticum TaxID=1526412 RepID=A0A7W4YNH3_9MICO|nr:thiolase family protein [Microbacterium endophyticum]MBB2976177.1 acetyl-CoA acyltransferase [Microbacterium endophyticum]NIK36474.1 acetyl-CoA acyltransferase [Microbacterium endophyticum]